MFFLLVLTSELLPAPNENVIQNYAVTFQDNVWTLLTVYTDFENKFLVIVPRTLFSVENAIYDTTKRFRIFELEFRAYSADFTRFPKSEFVVTLVYFPLKYQLRFNLSGGSPNVPVLKNVSEKRQGRLFFVDLSDDKMVLNFYLLNSLNNVNFYLKYAHHFLATKTCSVRCFDFRHINNFYTGTCEEILSFQTNYLKNGVYMYERIK